MAYALLPTGPQECATPEEAHEKETVGREWASLRAGREVTAREYFSEHGIHKDTRDDRAKFEAKARRETALAPAPVVDDSLPEERAAKAAAARAEEERRSKMTPAERMALEMDEKAKAAREQHNVEKAKDAIRQTEPYKQVRKLLGELLADLKFDPLANYELVEATILELDVLHERLDVNAATANLKRIREAAANKVQVFLDERAPSIDRAREALKRYSAIPDKMDREPEDAGTDGKYTALTRIFHDGVSHCIDTFLSYLPNMDNPAKLIEMARDPRFQREPQKSYL